VEVPEADLCCGSAGTYNLGQGEMGERLGRRKAAVLASAGARIVVTANPGCHLQLAPYLRERGIPIVSLARFLVDRLADPVGPLPRLPPG
jgi:glycolate oxidase iron-sulfur subunit